MDQRWTWASQRWTPQRWTPHAWTQGGLSDKLLRVDDFFPGLDGLCSLVGRFFVDRLALPLEIQSGARR